MEQVSGDAKHSRTVCSIPDARKAQNARGPGRMGLREVHSERCVLRLWLNYVCSQSLLTASEDHTAFTPKLLRMQGQGRALLRNMTNQGVLSYPFPFVTLLCFRQHTVLHTGKAMLNAQIFLFSDGLGPCLLVP